MSGRHVVCQRAEIAEGTAKRFELSGHAVCVVRFEDDDLYAIGDTCSHADISLAEGEVLPDTREIECWKHGSAFSLETGVPQTLPATQPVPVYEVFFDGDDIVVVIS
jgi:3-phenylpropionate/trans-cinnamate dioxygenase ferredoxin component